MATTLQMYIAGLALIVNTFTIALMYFLGNVILAPILNGLGKYITGNQTIPMYDIGFIMPAIWAILLIMEIIIVVSFLVVVGRRVTVEDYYE